MFYPLLRLARLVPLTALIFAANARAQERDGRLTSSCTESQGIASRPCRWVVRYEPEDDAEHKAIKTALGDLTAVQPPQFDGDRASVLTKKKSGQFVVIYLEKRDGTWHAASQLSGVGKKTKAAALRRPAY